MSVTFNPFLSKYGFKSDGFEVDSSGNLSAENLNVQSIAVNTDITANSVDVSIIKLNGSVLFGSGTGSATFQLENDFIVSEGSTPYLSVINGQISINNRSDSTGTIDNVDIGTVTPGTGVFTDLTSNNITSVSGIFSNLSTVELGVPVLESNTNLILSATNALVFKVNGVNKGKVNSSGIDIPVVNTTINNTSIGLLVPAVASFTSATITEPPATPLSATTKNYVDNRVSAFAIAFGM